jgi:predicted amidohydrolase
MVVQGGKMRIGFYQFAPRFGRPRENLKILRQALQTSRVDLLVLPELATSGYLFRSRREVARAAEALDGPSVRALAGMARDHGCHLVAGLPEAAGDRFYNSAVLVSPAGLVGCYRKVHLFNEEKRFFSPGESLLPLFDLGGVNVGLLVCFDHMFPEAARTLALQGAQVICHPSCLVLPEYGQLTTRVRALENRLFWVLANRHGCEDRGGVRLVYTGCSQVVAPSGEILARAGAAEDALTVVDIDPRQADNKQVTPLNDLFADRRSELYVR